MAIDMNKELAQIREVNVLLNSNILDAIQSASESKELSQEAINQLGILFKVVESHLNAASESLKQQIHQSGIHTKSDILGAAKKTSQEIADAQAAIKEAAGSLNKDHQNIMKRLYEQHDKLIQLIEAGQKKSQEAQTQLSTTLKSFQDEQFSNHMTMMNNLAELSQSVSALKETTLESLAAQSKKLVRSQWIGFILVLLALGYVYFR